MRREIAFIDHLLGLIVALTSLDGCQDWMAMCSAWGPILPQQVFIHFPLPTCVSGISIAGAKRLLGSLRQLCSAEECGSLLKWQPMVSALGTLGLAGRMK